jgi:hypothetical protein
MAVELNAPDKTPQILHGANFGDGGDPLETRISELMDRIGEGLREDDATNFEKLQIARKYGPFVVELKSVTPHGEFMRRLKARFPQTSYDKCNRWRYLAENEERGAATLEKFPDVAWGPKKMIDFLKGCWSPEAEDEEERYDGDEDEYSGYPPTELFVREEDEGDADELNVNKKEETEETVPVRSSTFSTSRRTHTKATRRVASSQLSQENEQSPVAAPTCRYRLVDQFSSMAKILTGVAALMTYLDWSEEDDLEWRNEIEKVQAALNLVSQTVQPKKRKRGRPPKTSQP